MAQPKSAIAAANRIYRKYETRNPEKLAHRMDIIVEELLFKNQKGVYTIIDRQPIIMVKAGLHPVTRSIVIAHELGHHILHKDELKKTPSLQEFNIFDMTTSRIEYEANVFAAQLMLPDDEITEYIYQGFDVQQIARAMKSDINLVALKVAELRSQGHELREQEYRNKFY